MTEATIVDDDRVGFFNDGQDWKLLDSATDAYSISLATAPFPPDQAWVPGNWDFNIFWRRCTASDAASRCHETWCPSAW